MADVKTITITNFGGRLTRILNGDLNSGFAKFSPSFGYDPFSKPMNLTWLESPTDITGPINNLPQAGLVMSASLNGPNIHMIDQGGRWYQIKSSSLSNPSINSVVGISSVATQQYLFGTSMQFFGSVVGQDLAGNPVGKLYVGGDSAVKSINPDGSGEATVGNLNSYRGNVYKPLEKFAGGLFFGNGNTIGKIDSTGTVTSSVIGTGNGNLYSALNPPLDTNDKVLDMDTSISNDYLILGTSEISQTERLDSVGYDIIETFGSQGGRIALWNGVDSGVTAATNLPSYLISEVHTFFKTNAFFAADSFGTAVNDGTAKILTLPDNKAPLPNAVAVNGNFLTWACPEVVGTKRYLSLYYYGQLDAENPKGLFRVLRWETTQSNGFVNKVPLNLIVSNIYKSINNALNALATFGYGKHYIGLNSTNTGGLQSFLLSFLVTPTGTGTPQLGVYETQTQLFSKKISVTQLRMYTEPTVAGNGFKIDLIGSDGAIMQNGTFNYTFVAGSDSTQLQGSFQRINYLPNCDTQFALGIRITNTGTTNMTFKKIEVDWCESGK